MIEAAVALIEAEGEAGFSLRKVAARIGCDPMAVLYHFGKKDGLERAIAEWLNEQIVLEDAAKPWDARLLSLALQYLALARRYPKSFPLLLRFWTTGPADLRLAEYGYAAFREAGHADIAIADLCLGWYASVLGLAAADAGGLLRPASAEITRALEGLDPAQFPVTAEVRSALISQAQRCVFSRVALLMVDAVRQRPISGGVQS
jgi:AcrR family transcriptional regulator